MFGLIERRRATSRTPGSMHAPWLIELWAPEAPPAREAVPQLAQLWQRVPGLRLVIVANVENPQDAAGALGGTPLENATLFDIRGQDMIGPSTTSLGTRLFPGELPGR